MALVSYENTPASALQKNGITSLHFESAVGGLQGASITSVI